MVELLNQQVQMDRTFSILLQQLENESGSSNSGDFMQRLEQLTQLLADLDAKLGSDISLQQQVYEAQQHLVKLLKNLRDRLNSNNND
ncbi:MAG: hypothetical protein QNJ46_32240 [Leptolyngbyaceae cyanobacterium MO_188.B28]|nr:hypothetical protein [Leptolyngbyaceae cyanobacterium MO_188.B28]